VSNTALPGEDTQPLTDQERQQLNRMLSDPTIYPLVFKSWLVSYIESSEIDLPMQNVHGLLQRLSDIEARLPP